MTHTNTTNNIMQEWQKITSSKQSLDKLLYGMFWKVAKKQAAGKENPDRFLQLATDAKDDITNTAFILIVETLQKIDTINAERAQKGKEPLNMALVAYRATETAMRRYWAQECRQPNGVSTVIDEKGIEKQIVEIVESKHQLSISRNLELKDAIIGSCKDDVDRAIISLLLAKETQKTIAEILGKPQQTINSRICQLRQRIKKAI